MAWRRRSLRRVYYVAGRRVAWPVWWIWASSLIMGAGLVAAILVVRSL